MKLNSSSFSPNHLFLFYSSLSQWHQRSPRFLPAKWGGFPAPSFPISRPVFSLLPLQKSFNSNSSSKNWNYLGIKMQASWTLYAGGCNFKGNFFCWVFSVTRGFGELIFTVSVVGGGSGGGSGRKEELLFLAALPCGYLSPFVPWNYGEGGKLEWFCPFPQP